MIAWSLAVLLRGIDVLLLFRRSRNFYIILIESFDVSKPFLVIIIYICIALALANNLLDIGNEDKSSLLERALVIFNESLSVPDIPEDDEAGQRYANWILILYLLLVSTIIGFNTLIAIIGDSFDKTQLESRYYDAVQKFALLNELNDIYMFWNRNATEQPEKVFIHIITYADTETTKRDWQGKMQNIKEVVVEESKTVKKQITEVKQEIEKQNAKIESVEQEIKQEIKQEIDGVKQEMNDRFDQIMKLLKNDETKENWKN